MKADCIFFEETYEEIPNFRHCKRKKTLYVKGDEDNSMCRFCNLWDSYIPNTATDADIEKAYQDGEMDEQDYNLVSMLNHINEE